MNQNHLDTWFILYTVFLYFFHRGLINIIKKLDDHLCRENLLMLRRTLTKLADECRHSVS